MASYFWLTVLYIESLRDSTVNSCNEMWNKTTKRNSVARVSTEKDKVQIVPSVSFRHFNILQNNKI